MILYSLKSDDAAGGIGGRKNTYKIYLRRNISTPKKITF